jgi:hypothetical protein
MIIPDLNSSSARLAPAIPAEVPMRLIGLAVVLAVSLTLAPLAAEGPQTEKVAESGSSRVRTRIPRSTTPSFRQILRCIQRPCDIRAAQAINLSGDRFQKALAN